MNNIRRNSRIFIIYSSLLTLLMLSGCITPLATQSSEENSLIGSAETSVPCDACVQATLAAGLNQINDNADYQAVATAEIVRANAQATLDSANATLSAVQTQDQNDANIVAAQIAGTAEIVRADAQATLNSAGATQSSALTQDAIQQTQIAAQATTGAQALLQQQNSDELAAGTQTAIADNIATQTQVAAATSQWYADQERQRDEQRRGPIAFLWMWCLPLFILILAGLIIWGFWRRLKIQQDNQRILAPSVERLPPTIDIAPHQHDDSLPYIESDIIDAHYQPVKPDDQVRGWLDEVKDELISRDKEDEDDHPNN
jgi:hypothetical protein